MESYPDNSLCLRLTFREDSTITLLDISSLLYDFTLLYDTVVLSTVDGYEKFKFTQYFWRRNGRGIKDSHQILLKSIRHESPLEFVTILTAAALSMTFIWAFIQSIDKVSNWDINKEKLHLDVDNAKLLKQSLKKDAERKRLENQKLFLQNQQIIADREAAQTIQRIVERLSKNPLVAVKAEIFSTKENATDGDVI